MDFELAPEQKEIQALARDFAQQEIDPHAAEWDREHHFPRDLFSKLAELGLMGTCVPEEYGGAGADFPSYILVLEELSRADAGVGVTVAVHTSAVTLPLLAFGTDEQRSRFVPPLARGEHLGAFALTEAEAGSDAGALRTRAEPDGDGWRITGAKQWITNARYSGTFLLFARTDQNTPGARGVSAFVLDADHVRVTRDEEKLGLNSSITNDIVIEGAHVDRDRLLHEEGKGFHIAMTTLDGGRIGIAAQALGIAQAAYDVAREYVDACVARGLDVDDFAPRLSFFFNAHLDFFEEIAKYRAARRIWATQLRDKYGAKNPRSWLMRFHTQTAGVSLTAQQPEVNLIRTAIEALAAVLGGTQSLHTNSFDEALALPTENAARLALRTQQVIAHETGVVNTADPLGGSYYLEYLTNELERQAYHYFDRIEKLGGVIPAIEENFFQREIAEASFRYQSEVERKQRVIVGVNKYVQEDEQPLEILRIDPELETKQIERVRATRAKRDAAAAEAALAELKRAAAGDTNLMPPILDAARARVTMGEMCDALREVWGIWRETPVF
ncbi:MAG TPA: methylmalonyl-CoA mutase family protein [Gaiellaceae bacterium]|nr:methylmalonyl-CoA mutase family protein [Gaiellaceae bacterium]